MAFSRFETQRRFVARVALYGSLALIGVVATSLVWLLNQPFRPQATEGWIQRDYLHLPVVQRFQRYVQIDTSPTTGDEVAGARFLARQLEAAGIPAHLEQLGERHANLWAILEGEDRRAIVLHNHIDVTPIDDESEWFVRPFAGTIELPWIYGRGVFDMKSVAIAQLEAVLDLQRALQRSGKPLRRSVMFLATGGEEYGSYLGTQWILRQHPELRARMGVVLTEGGVIEARTRNDIKYWGVEFAQKRFVDLVVCGSNLQQLEELRGILTTRIQHRDHLRLVPEVAAFLAVYAKSRDRSDLRAWLAQPADLLQPTPPAVAAFRALPGYLQSMFRDEAVAFSLREAEGGGYELTIKLHLLPGAELAEVRDRVLPPALLHGLPVTLRELPTSRHGSPLDHPILPELYAAIRERYPGTPTGPMFLPWTATDARFFRQAGIPAYGFSPFLIMSTDTFQVDAPNERIALPGFVDGVTLYADVLRRLAL
jgi:acetylornithine deacetylase/succinyl-diaminopimelate desuccinylase-like protein